MRSETAILLYSTQTEKSKEDEILGFVDWDRKQQFYYNLFS
jgi:hypothetical protein